MALLALAGCAAGIALGNWQAGRAADRRALGALYDSAMAAKPLSLSAAPITPDAYLHKRVSAKGRLLAQHTMFLGNRLRDGRQGFEVLTPMTISGGNLHVIVNRGWIASGAQQDTPPVVTTPVGERTIEGVALITLSRVLEPPGYTATGNVRQNLRLEDFRAATGLTVLPIFILQTSNDEDGLLRRWPRPDALAAKNEMYSMQWYFLAALSIALFLIYSCRRDADTSD